MKIAILFISICLGCSCVRKDFVEKNIEEAPLQIFILPSSRGTTPLSDGEEIGVYVAENTPEGTYNEETYHNVRGVIQDGQVKFDEDIMLSSTDAKIYAYYPYNSSYTDPRKIKFSTKVSKTKDLLASKIEGLNLFHPNANIELQHLCCGVRIKLRNLSGESNLNKLHQVILRNNTDDMLIHIVGDLDLYSCTVTPSSMRIPTMSITLDESYLITDSFPSDDQSIDFNLLPTTVSEGDLTLEVSFGNGFNRRAFVLPSVSWEAGKLYTYELTITS